MHSSVAGLDLVLVFAVSFAFFSTTIVILLLIQKKDAVRIQNSRRQKLTTIFNFENLKINYRWLHRNHKPTIVFLHGYGASHKIWDSIVDNSLTDYSIVTLDLLGFGGSSKLNNHSRQLDIQVRSILALLDHLEIREFHIVGSSMGGKIALWSAVVAPTRILSLCMMSPALEPKIMPFPLHRCIWLARVLALLVNRFTVKALLKRVHFNHAILTPTFVDKHLEDYIFEPQKSVAGLILASQVLRDPRPKNHLERLKCPTLLLWGAKDRVTPLKNLTALTKNTSALVRVHPKVGHHLMEENPLWTADQILGFLETSGLKK